MRALDFGIIAIAAAVGWRLAPPFFLWLAATALVLLLGRLLVGERL